MILMMMSTTTCFQSVDDLDSELIFGIPFFTLVKQSFDIVECFSGDENASGGMFGLGAHMYADAFAFRHFVNEGHLLSEPRRPCEAERIGSSRDEEVSVFECVKGHLLLDITARGFVEDFEREVDFAANGEAITCLADE